jgi:hypothetical protein
MGKNGKNCDFELEGRCSIQLSYGRNRLLITIYTDEQRQAEPTAAQSGKDWHKTQFAKLGRYVPSATYYARLRVKGKLAGRA